MSDFLDKFEHNVTSKNKTETDYIEVEDESLKIALDGAGFAYGRLYLLNGHDHACLFACLKMALEAQRKGFLCIVDNECMIDNKMIDKFSLDKEFLLYHQVEEQNDMFDILSILLKTNTLKVIIFNTILSLFPITVDIKEFTVKLNTFMVEFKHSNCCVFIVNPYNNLTYTFLNDYIDVIINTYFVKDGKIACNFIKNEVNFTYNNFVL
jgi:hypothetical protein